MIVSDRDDPSASRLVRKYAKVRAVFSPSLRCVATCPPLRNWNSESPMLSTSISLPANRYFTRSLSLAAPIDDFRVVSSIDLILETMFFSMTEDFSIRFPSCLMVASFWARSLSLK
jgi:hypothetical protein